MRMTLAAFASIGLFVFAIGASMFLVYHSEAAAVANHSTGELDARYESLSEKALHGLYLAAFGGGLAMFIIFLDEEKKAREKLKEKGFFV
jgi:putative copper export protein